MKKKVLIVIQQLRRGGVEVAAINFASHLDQNKYEFTYYLQKIESEQDKELIEKIKSSNSRVIIKNKIKDTYLENYKDALKVMRETKYDVVHSHVMFYNGIIMYAAKKCGIKKRISHSHASKWNHKETIPFKIYRYFMRKLINRYATDKLACSTDAGNYMYGKKEYKKHGTFLANGIDIKEYNFSQKIRNKKRKELNVKENEILVGHIGTLYWIKNQVFLVEIFAKMLKENSNMKLVLAGEKVETEDILKKAKEFGVTDKLIILGQVNDVKHLLQAYDIMIFPSLNEGLPVSLIEAQATKLPCLISNRVTKEVKFNENVDFMSLEKSAEKWCEKAFKLLKTNRESIDISKLTESYDINIVAEKLDRIYNS